MRKSLKNTLLLTSTVGLIHPLRAPAQNDDFLTPPPPPAFDDSLQDNFGEPPPIINPVQANPTSSSRSAGTPSSSANNDADKYKIPNRSGSGSGSSVLNNRQKQRFAEAGAEDITNENFPETIESFDFPNAEITDVIKAISELTGKNFIIEPSVRGKITIVAPSKITVAEAYKAFLSALAINSFTVVPSGNFLKIKNSRAATRDNIETYSGAYYPNTDQMITRIVHLKHISAEQVNRELRMFNTKDGEMNPYPPTNSIIISDYGTAIDRFMKVISQLDVPGFEEQLVVIPIKYAKAKDLADLIDKIVNKGGRSSSGGGVGAPGAFNAGVPRFTRGGAGTSSQQGASFFMSIPDDRTNSIIVTGNKSGIERVRKLVEKLDFRLSPEDSGGVNVYYVRHGDAKKIAQTLQGVTKDGQASRPGSPSPFAPIGPGGFAAAQTEIFGGDVKIQADETTNSLVITASKQDYATVLDILKKIDIPRDQVYVEAIISEISLEDGANWGVGYYKFGEQGYGKAGFNSGLDLTKVLNPVDSSAGSILTFASGGPVKMKTFTPGSTTTSTIEVPSIVGFINLLKETSKLNILSTPQIMALDNQDATISVGTRIPVAQAGTTTSNGVTSQGGVNFEDANIELKIKPFINPTSSTVRMEIDQSLKQPALGGAAPEAFRASTVTLAQRKIKTNIVVTSGDTAVLGGLIQDREIEEVKKVPLLGDIPVLGWLFKGSKKTISKINLLIFLTPRIVRNPAASLAVTNEKLEERREGIKDLGGKDQFGKRMDKLTSRNSLIDDGSGAQTPEPQEEQFTDELAPEGTDPNQNPNESVEEAPLYE